MWFTVQGSIILIHLRLLQVVYEEICQIYDITETSNMSGKSVDYKTRELFSNDFPFTLTSVRYNSRLHMDFTVVSNTSILLSSLNF